MRPKKTVSNWRQTFEWFSRPATSGLDGLGFATVVGGYDVLVRERRTGRPVTGAMVIAATPDELRQEVESMLSRFAVEWSKQQPDERRRNLAIAAETACTMGWE